ncbi:hypothetical protein PIB30_090518, partial [Stylosanthes scabra]|nr:hypothetical protein [Stylosanthes scabra]
KQSNSSDNHMQRRLWPELGDSGCHNHPTTTTFQKFKGMKPSSRTPLLAMVLDDSGAIPMARDTAAKLAAAELRWKLHFLPPSNSFSLSSCFPSPRWQEARRLLEMMTTVGSSTAVTSSSHHHRILLSLHSKPPTTEGFSDDGAIYGGGSRSGL